MKTWATWTAALLALAALTSCGGGGQSEHSSPGTPTEELRDRLVAAGVACSGAPVEPGDDLTFTVAPSERLDCLPDGVNVTLLSWENPDDAQATLAEGAASVCDRGASDVSWVSYGATAVVTRGPNAQLEGPMLAQIAAALEVEVTAHAC